MKGSGFEGIGSFHSVTLCTGQIRESNRNSSLLFKKGVIAPLALTPGYGLWIDRVDESRSDLLEAADGIYCRRL